MTDSRADFAGTWATEVKKVLPGGRLVGQNGSMWVVRGVPLSPVVDARDSRRVLDAAIPLMQFFSKLGNLANTTGARRMMNRGTYREWHIELVNIPDWYKPGDGNQLYDLLVDSYGDKPVQRRILVAAVRLIPRLTRKNESAIKSAFNSVVSVLAGTDIPLVEYEDDYDVIDKIMRDSGFFELERDVFGRRELNLARFWYNFGRSGDIPVLVHGNHLHFFSTAKSAQTAELLQRRADEAGKIPECEKWKIPDSHALTLATISELDLPWVSFDESVASWMVALLDTGARAVSLRGFVEPAKVTRGELRRKRNVYRSDIEDQAGQANSDDARQEEKLAELQEIERAYAKGGGTPTLIDVSVVIAFNGLIPNIERHLGDRADNIELSSLENRQQAALAEMELCSPIRATPHLHDWPSQTLAASGITNLSTVGDKDGALLGFTEFDRQPAYVNPMAASTADQVPFLVVAGASGSGKTVALLSLARQWMQWINREGNLTPVIMVDPKTGQDFSKPVEEMGGQVFSLDDMVKADGALDPIRILRDKEEAIGAASSMLSSINPWGHNMRQAFEVPLLTALRYGVMNGGTCIVEALRIADAYQPLPEGLLDPIVGLAESSPMARALIGIKPGGTPLRDMEGLTLIRAGNTVIPLPDQGIPWDQTPLMTRVGAWVLRMMVYGAASAVSYRDGVLILDESWQFMIGDGGKAEIKRLERLSRSMRFLPVLASQFLSDFVDAGLSGSISRGIILPLSGGSGQINENGVRDDGEAGLALDLFEVSRDTKHLQRLTAKATVEGSDQPNWQSMRALRDPVTREVKRGAIGLYVDMSGRVVPTEIVIPPDFLAAVSTSAEDVIARQRAEQSERS